MRLNSLPSVFFAGMMILVGCGGGGGGGTTTPPIDPPETNETIIITGDYQVDSLGSANTINANVILGSTPKDLYLVLSNNAATSASATISHNAKVASVAQTKSIVPTGLTERPEILRHPQYVEDFSSQIGALLSKEEPNQLQAKTLPVSERMEDIEGASQIFYLDTTTTESTLATARKVIAGVPTIYGLKTLNIWVSNDSFDSGSGCSKLKCVTQDMVDALADTFLLGGLDNDIYDWVTNIYGEEWDTDAQSKYSQLIGADNEITILLTDIGGDDSPNGGVIGFFWSKDNFDKTSVSGSNERVMFYIDSVMFANGGSPWSIDDQWPKETVSTLAHEFQHMIDFYQKNVLLNANADTWIKEMLSESTEDIIATKIEHSVEGRYPLFNENNMLSLTTGTGPLDNNGNPTFVLADYSKVNVFGAYLLRNYGGAELLHNIMHNSFEDQQAVVDAVNKSPMGSGKMFADLLSEWGVAVMLSDYLVDVDTTPVYNIGTALFEDVYGSTLYEMNSINFFNYTPQPTIYTTSGTVQPQGNYYYKIGDNITGDINITLELNGQTEATLIAK